MADSPRPPTSSPRPPRVVSSLHLPPTPFESSTNHVSLARKYDKANSEIQRLEQDLECEIKQREEAETKNSLLVKQNLEGLTRIKELEKAVVYYEELATGFENDANKDADKLTALRREHTLMLKDFTLERQQQTSKLEQSQVGSEKRQAEARRWENIAEDLKRRLVDQDGALRAMFDYTRTLEERLEVQAEDSIKMTSSKEPCHSVHLHRDEQLSDLKQEKARLEREVSALKKAGKRSETLQDVAGNSLGEDVDVNVCAVETEKMVVQVKTEMANQQDGTSEPSILSPSGQYPQASEVTPHSIVNTFIQGATSWNMLVEVVEWIIDGRLTVSTGP